jgi:hypothetical protein
VYEGESIEVLVITQFVHMNHGDWCAFTEDGLSLLDGIGGHAVKWGQPLSVPLWNIPFLTAIGTPPKYVPSLHDILLYCGRPFTAVYANISVSKQKLSLFREHMFIE